MEINITLAKTKKDFWGLIDVQVATWADTYENIERGVSKKMILDHFGKKFTPEKRLERFKSLKDIKRKNWVAKHKERVVAWLGCSKDFEKQTGSFAIYVLPEFQGQGIGKRMLKRGFKWLSDMKQIEIGVIEYNPRAIGLYKSLGFEFTGEKEDFKVGEFVGKKWVLKMKKPIS